MLRGRYDRGPQDLPPGRPHSLAQDLGFLGDNTVRTSPSRIRLDDALEGVTSMDLERSDQVLARVAARLEERILAAKVAQAGAAGAWRVELPPVDVFCRDWLKQPLYAGPQTGLAFAMWGKDPLTWRGGSTFNRLYAQWGKRGGKDSTLAKLDVYGCAKIVALRDPWGFFGVEDGSPIDMLNVSYNALQAREVFFKYLKTFMRRCINPATGRNFFEQMGLDLREGGKCFQAKKMVLNDRKTAGGEDTICFHSRDSKEVTGEGFNLLFATLDELGAFPSAVKAEALHDAVVETSLATFGRNACVAAASYIYAKHDAMMSVYEKAEDAEKMALAYRSRATTFDCNPKVDRGALEILRIKNPKRFNRVYLCQVDDAENQFFRPSEEVRGQCSLNRDWPMEGNVWRTDDLAGLAKKLKPWFTGTPGVPRWVHVDLATGKDGRDKAGLAMGRPQRKRASYSEAYMTAQKINGKDLPPLADAPRDGVFLDLMLQIVAPPGREVDFQTIIDFLVHLRDVLKFDIQGVSYDGWNSRGELQRLENLGFHAVQFSVDRTNEPAETTKELVYAGLLDYYPHPVFLREAEELVYDKREKVDHPEKSLLREQEEGDPRGSKDVWDGVCGAVANLMELAPATGEGGDPWF